MKRRADESKVCPVCNVRLFKHPRCACCRSLTGDGHDSHLTPFRGKNICLLCIRRWKQREKSAGKPLSWREVARELKEKENNLIPEGGCNVTTS